MFGDEMKSAWEFGAVFVRLKEVLRDHVGPVRYGGFPGNGALVRIVVNQQVPYWGVGNVEW